MIRTQIYLTTIEKKQLSILANETEKTQSELIREAIDLFIESKQKKKKEKLSLIQTTKGMWKNRIDLPDFTKLRREFDRVPYKKK